MAEQKIPKLTPDMLRRLPNQTCEILNRVIDRINKEL